MTRSLPGRSALMSWAIMAAMILGVSAPLLPAHAADNPTMPSGVPGGPGGPGEHGGPVPHGPMGMMPFGRHLGRMLDEVKATPAQRQQIKQINEKARTDLQALHEQGKALHEQGMAVWTAPKIDPAAAEKLRQQMLAHHDQVSKRMLQAMLDVGNVLTPEQRAKMGQLMKARQASTGERLRGWMHGGKRGEKHKDGHEDDDGKSAVDH